MLSYEDYKKLFEASKQSKVEVPIADTTPIPDISLLQSTLEEECEEDVKSDIVGTLGLIPPRVAKRHASSPDLTASSSELPPIPTADQLKQSRNTSVIAGARAYKTSGVAMWSQYRKLNYAAYKAANPTGNLHSFTSQASKQWKGLSIDQKAQAHLTPGLHYDPLL